jgi:probable HAF family extracellular repeat protein
VVLVSAVFFLWPAPRLAAQHQSTGVSFTQDHAFFIGKIVSRDGGKTWTFIGWRWDNSNPLTIVTRWATGNYNPATHMLQQPDSLAGAWVEYLTAGATGQAIGQTGDPAIVGFLDDGMGGPYHASRLQISSDYTTGELTDLGTLDPANNGRLFSFAYAASSDGSVVVGASALADGLTEHAFIWTEQSGMVDLGPGSLSGPGGFSRAFGVSGDGSVVVGDEGDPMFPTATKACIWTANGGFQDLGFSGSAYAVTSDGSVVAGHASNVGAFLWTQSGGMQVLGTLPGFTDAEAIGVSDDGQTVVGISAPRPLSRTNTGYDYDIDCLPFVWTAATGMQDLNQLLANAGVDMTGISLYAITGLSTDGQVVSGIGRGPQNDPNNPYDTSGFIAQLPQ